MAKRRAFLADHDWRIYEATHIKIRQSILEKHYGGGVAADHAFKRLHTGSKLRPHTRSNNSGTRVNDGRANQCTSPNGDSSYPICDDFQHRNDGGHTYNHADQYSQLTSIHLDRHD